MFHNRHYVHANDHIKGIDTALSVLPTKDREHTPEVAKAHEAVTKFKNYPEPYSSYDIAGILANVTAEELPAKVTELATTQSERELVKGARKSGAIDQVEQNLEAALIASQDAYAERIQTTAAKVCADVTKAAKGIPADKALDPAAAIAGDFVDQHRTILDGLTTLNKLTGIYNPQRPKEATKGIGVAFLADIPKTTTTIRDSMWERTLNPEQEQHTNDGVKQLLKDYDNNPTQTVVNVAAGQYPGVTLSIPANTAQLEERRANLYTATLIKRGNAVSDKHVVGL